MGDEVGKCSFPQKVSEDLRSLRSHPTARSLQPISNRHLKLCMIFLPFYPLTCSFCHLSSFCKWHLHFPSCPSQKAWSPSYFHNLCSISNEPCWLHLLDTQTPASAHPSTTTLGPVPTTSTWIFAGALKLVSPE